MFRLDVEEPEVAVAVVRGRTRVFETAEQELSEAEIRERYGDVLASGIEILTRDPDYLVAMARAGAALVDR